LFSSGRQLDVPQIRGGQLAAFADNIVAELLPLVEVAHAGALDHGNIDEYVFPAAFRLYEAKTPFVN